MQNKRLPNYDLLRAFCVIAVIMIHVSSVWVVDFTEKMSLNQNNIDQLIHPLIACVYNSISRFAVPCFLMISGSFLLCNDENMDYQYFYSKKCLSTLNILAFFTVAYVLYRILLMMLGYGNDSYLTILFDIIKGAPMYHMWYMYMLIIIYLAVPIVIRFKKSITFLSYKRVSFLFFILASLSRWTVGNVVLNWDIGQAFEFLSYLMIGDVIKAESKKNNIFGTILITTGFCIELLTAYLEYYVQIVHGIKENELPFRIVDAYAPTIAFASLLIFGGISKIRVKATVLVDIVVKNSLLVYLMHVGVIDLLKQLCKLILDGRPITNYDCLWAIPTMVIITLILSLFLSNVYVFCGNYLTANIFKNNS